MNRLTSILAAIVGVALFIFALSLISLAIVAVWRAVLVIS